MKPSLKMGTMPVFHFNVIFCAILPLFSANAAATEKIDLPEINVSAHKDIKGADFQAKDVLTDEDVLSVQDLKTTRSVSLGATLEQVTGVQNHAFGPNNGLPQIRSLSGPRVYVSENGMGVSDMAALSGNLPTMVNPFLAEKITVSKSSAAVLYGGNAIGGAVDVDTGALVRRLPEKDLEGRLELGGGYNTPQAKAFRLDGRLGRFGWHLDGGDIHGSDYRIPGNAKPDLCYDPSHSANSRLLWNCQVTHEKEEVFNPGAFHYVHKRGRAWLDELEARYGDSLDDSEMYKRTIPSWGNPDDWVENPLYDGSTESRISKVTAVRDDTPVEKGRLKNSAVRMRNASAGVSYIGERGYAGVSFSRYMSRAGIPGFAYYNIDGAGNRSLAAEPASVKSAQTRWTAEALYRPQAAWADNIRFQTAFSDTPNSEYLGDTEVQTLNSKTLQNRLEFNHRPNAWLSGSIGADWRHRKTESSGIGGRRTGNYAYLPDTESREYGIFLLENASWGKWNASLGGRYGRVRHRVHLNGYEPGRNSATRSSLLARAETDFPLRSYQAKLDWKPWDFWKLTARFSRSQRAPEINELYAGGNHYAVLANESHTHDKLLKPETASTWEFGSEWKWRNLLLRTAIYQTRFKDYIYLSDSSHDGGNRLPTKYWRAADTEIKGFEWEWTAAFDWGRYGMAQLRLFGDTVKNHADLKDERNRDSYSDRVRNDGYYMPNMPVSRYGAGAVWNKGRWQLSTDITRYRAAKHTGNMAAGYREPVLGRYTLWNAYLSYGTKLGNTRAEWFLDGRNLLNRTIRAQNSALKYIAPQPGRSLRTGLRLSF